MSARKTERLLNLVLALLSTRRYLSVGEIREAVQDYRENSSEEAFRRMFERDKEELRDLGIPLETGSHSHFDDEVGYRIARRDYELPAIALEPDEATVVALAGRLWHAAPLSAAATLALAKLRTDAQDPDDPLPRLDPRVDAVEPAFAPFAEAVVSGRPIAFDYRAPGSAAPARRHLEPWGVVSWHGHWYAVGHDRDRGESRVFRLDRVVGDVQMVGKPGSVQPPADLDARALVEAAAGPPPSGVARLRVRTGRAADLRRQAVAVEPAEPGWDLLTVAYPGAGRLVQRVSWYAADVVIVDPPEAREAALAWLRELVATG